MPKARKHVEVDSVIGRRLRERRKMLGMSQTVLAARLGVAFQMIQRYEYGRCRISAATLYDLSGILGVEVSYFFAEIPLDPVPADAADAAEVLSLGLARTRYGLTVAAWFPRIVDLDVQRVIADLIQAAADGGAASIVNLEV